MKKNMYRIFALVLVLVLALSMVACGPKAPQETDPTETTGSNNETTEAPTDNTDVEFTPITYFSMSYGETIDSTVYLTVSSLDGVNSIDYFGAERKMGELDEAGMETLSIAFAKTNLKDLVGKDVYDEGEAAGSMYIEFSDGTSASVGFSGNVPETFKTGFAAMESCFQTLTADMPEYVPQATVMGEVDADRLAAIQEILNNSGIQGLDGLQIADVPMDENFGFSMGLSSTDGITGGSLCNAMMMTTAYSFAVVTVEDESKIDAVRADFEENLDFGKWVCVRPTDAVIAQKGNLVLCVMGADSMYTGTKAAIEAAGWQNLATFKDTAE